MKALYGTCRYERITELYNLDGGMSLNGVYTPGFYLNNQFGDWNKAGLTNVIDNLIPEENYILEIIPGIPKLTRFVLCEYNEKYVVPDELTRSLENVGARFNLDILTGQEAIAWLKANTSLSEITQGKFLISPETEMMGEIIPARYLTIE